MIPKTSSTPESQYGSIFSQCLLKILQKHGGGFQILRRIGIDNHLIMQLGEALESPRRYRVPNPRQIRDIIDTFTTDPREGIELYAALMASWTQRQLLSLSISLQDAWEIAKRAQEALFPVFEKIERALHSKGADLIPKSGPVDLLKHLMEEYIDPALDAMNNAFMLEANAEYFFTPHLNEIWLQQALMYFAQAVALLDALRQAISPEAQTLDGMTDLSDLRESLRQQAMEEIRQLSGRAITLPAIPDLAP
jgi:hypothetical protein